MSCARLTAPAATLFALVTLAAAQGQSALAPGDPKPAPQSAPSGAASQPAWVQTTDGPGKGDSGDAVGAIILRQILDISKSPARTPSGKNVVYNHPSMLCQTREGTIIAAWDGGLFEGKGKPGNTAENRVFVARRTRDGVWQSPMLIDDKEEIDFGYVYQPRKAGAPVVMAYWTPRVSSGLTQFRTSVDDGKTWSDRYTISSTHPVWAAEPSKGHFHLSYHPPVEFPDGTLWIAGMTDRPAGDMWGPNRGAIVVAPPDNYSGLEKGGTPWGTIYDDAFAGNGLLPGLMVCSADYNEIMFVGRMRQPSVLTRDRGKTWTKLSTIPKGQAGTATLGLDMESPDRSSPSNAPARGWRVIVTDLKGRNGMGVYVSNDPEFKQWKLVLRLHENEPQEDADPNIIQSRFDRKLHLLFTGRHEPCLKYYVLDPDMLIAAAKK